MGDFEVKPAVNKEYAGKLTLEYGFVGAEQRLFIVIPGEDGLLVRSEANARRVVACVNFWAGAPTETLKSITANADLILDRWDQTEPAMQRKIVNAFAARMIAAEKEVKRLRTTMGELVKAELASNKREPSVMTIAESLYRENGGES